VRQVGTNLPKVGQYNRAVVLDQIQLTDGTSRVEIAEHTGLTPQTVSGIVRRLIDEGIVREDGARSSSGGKPRTVLRINADAGRAVGLHFDPVELTCVVVDLLGRPLVTARRPTPADIDPAKVTAAMAGLVEEVLAEAGVPREQVLGVGLAAPGPIDQSLGEVISPPQLSDWTRVPLKQLVADATGLPVTLDNDATAAAIGERWAGAGRGVANFAYFFLGTGVGGGLVLDGRVYRGAAWMAGEIGHVVLDPDGLPCACGLRGCFETIAGGAGIARAARLAIDAGARTELADLDQPTAAHVFAAAVHGDTVAAGLVDRAASAIARMVHELVLAYDVELVVIGGGISRAGAPLLDRIHAGLAGIAAASPFAAELLSETDVRLAGADHDIGTRGAIALLAPLMKEVVAREAVG